MYLRKITQFTTSSSAKLLFTSSSTTSALLLNNNIYKNTTTNTTKMMSTMTTTTRTNFSSRRGAIFSLKQQQQQHKKRSFSLTTRAMGAKVGDQISGVLQLGPWIDGMPTPVNMAERCKGKKVILVGLPGASLFSFSPKITQRDRSAADSFVGNYSLLLLRKVVLSIIINKYMNASLTNRNYLSHNITQTGAFTPT